MKTKQKSMYLLIGSMLFGLFFGAGNLIFPVHLGQQAGQALAPGVVGFLLTATGLPFLGVVAMGLTESKNVLEFGSRVHPAFGYALALMLYLTIGPLFALPRTATVSFEVGLTLLVPQEKLSLALAIFTLCFFAIALAFALRPAKILDYVGKVLNPIFLVFIGFLLIKAVLHPMGPVDAVAVTGSYQKGAFSTGFIDGYQTMDALAALAFGSIVVENIRRLGITEPEDVARSTMKSGVVTVLLMCVIYSGLAWLGAMSVNILPVAPNGGVALAQISRHYLGEFGSLFLTATITIACLKTAIGLITSCSNAFIEMFPNSFSYNTYAVIFAAFSCLVANVGLDQLIMLSMPVLMILYPLATVLILLSLVEKGFHGRRVVYVCSLVGAFFVGFGDALFALPQGAKALAPIAKIIEFYQAYVPLFEIGFGWFLPALVGAGIGLLIADSRRENQFPL